MEPIKTKTNLSILSVSPLSSCPSHLSLLVRLTSLFLSVSPLSSCPSHLSLLVRLTSLFLSVSPLSSCPSHLSLLVRLTSLFLSVSPHSSCPSHLSLLVSLTSLFLSVSRSPHVINGICDHATVVRNAALSRRVQLLIVVPPNWTKLFLLL